MLKMNFWNCIIIQPRKHIFLLHTHYENLALKCVLSLGRQMK
jgi:hypothetical protein